MAIYSEFSHLKWWFSIVMLNYQRVSAATFPGYLQSAELRRSHDFQPEDRGFFVTQMHKGHVSPKDIGLPMGGNSIVSGVSLKMGF